MPDPSNPTDGLVVATFATANDLEAWLEHHHATSPGVWVRLSRTRSVRESVTFHDLLVLGLCFGWSESTRRAYDDDSYLQKFTPRRKVGTASERNRRLVEGLLDEGRVRPAGLAALGVIPRSKGK
ncbi:MAG: hypothetical protein WBB44_01950 [Candidatus Nanopelagicales bacterium]|nr:hypothetical protein [Candidatus Nanopelagicales bacterium]